MANALGQLKAHLKSVVWNVFSMRVCICCSCSFANVRVYFVCRGKTKTRTSHFSPLLIVLSCLHATTYSLHTNTYTSNWHPGSRMHKTGNVSLLCICVHVSVIQAYCTQSNDIIVDVADDNDTLMAIASVHITCIGHMNTHIYTNIQAHAKRGE